MTCPFTSIDVLIVELLNCSPSLTRQRVKNAYRGTPVAEEGNDAPLLLGLQTADAEEIEGQLFQWGSMEMGVTVRMRGPHRES